MGLDGTPFFVVNGVPYKKNLYDLVKDIENSKK